MKRVFWTTGVLGVTMLSGAARAAEPAPVIVVEGAEARVAVELEPDGATLLRRSVVGTASSGSRSAVLEGYDEVCSDSCQVKLPAGSYYLALKHEDLGMTDAERVRIPSGDSTLRGTWESHRGMRRLGWTLALTSPITAWGTLLAFKAANDRKAVNGGQTAIGIGVGVVQLAIGIYLIAANGDTVSFDVVPSPRMALDPVPGVLDYDAALPKPEQLALNFTF